ncbi:hypothetical protein SAMN05216302_10084 [Nitrosomonas aestuarii]|uniref:Lipoprotein n=1 Tax=Nitrosomonas aestuarii TaxID=52441 RepID=A0A1I4A3Y7_9PROT|nr:hypothetical protein [Nitrosomonas aestuarii]SFK50586.1 hypothetical protein SAMN05216302_10084 [Nitrosomonas aestuarii]
MKTETGRYFLAFSMIVFLAACAPMTKLTSVQEGEIKFATQNSKKDLNHTVLARNHEKLAKEMRVKAQEQKEILKNKPSTSYLGRNGQRIKKRVARRIYNYEKAVEVNLAKAAHHKRIAQEQVNQKMFTKPDNAPDQIDKAKFKLNNSTSTETTEKL